jgi:acetylornithine deacetylase/succinyl-diaminopimelate desuccinylase-like protein
MDWDQLLKEAISYLQQYIRIQTVNPPGNEIEGAKFLKSIFDKESIPSELFEPSPGRGNLVAVLKGSGEKRPILLVNHIDVVPADRDKWEVDPFSAKIKDGYLYGRGALDDKSMGIVEMMILLILKREKIDLKRDLFFLASADEETGGKWGVEWAMENIPFLKESEFALNEGGHVIIDEEGNTDRYEVSCGQKVILQLQLKAIGTSGHASMPHHDNPNVKLIEALNRITKWETPYHVLPMVKEFFLNMAPKRPSYERNLFENIEKALLDPSFSVWLTSNPQFNAMIRNTISLTILQAGSKVNVIPSEARAILDCRLLPNASKEEFLLEVKKRVGDEIEIEVIGESQSVPPSPMDTDFISAIKNFASKNDPGCPVVPLLLPGATDSRFLREKGIATYDLCPFRLTEKEMLRIHGDNERISLNNLEFGMRMLFEIIREIST